MEEIIITCPTCEKEIFYGTNIKEVLRFNCCDPINNRDKKNKQQTNKDKQIVTHQDRLDLINNKIKLYRDYRSVDIWEALKSKLGCYRTFNRCLNELKEKGVIENKGFGFIRRCE